MGKDILKILAFVYIFNLSFAFIEGYASGSYGLTVSSCDRKRGPIDYAIPTFFMGCKLATKHKKK